MADTAEPAWSSKFTDEDWDRLDSINIPTITEEAWAGHGFPCRDAESTT